MCLVNFNQSPDSYNLNENSHLHRHNRTTVAGSRSNFGGSSFSVVLLGSLQSTVGSEVLLVPQQL